MNQDLSAGTTLSHYRIVSKIGAGGMGEVYLAEDTKLDRKVALKILPSDVAANQDRMRRFVQEAKAAAALNHPNIAHMYEIGESEGTNFIAMEFVDGKTLREKIHSEKSGLKVLLKHLLQVAEGLAKAHASGIVHRDLKPDNIMITSDGHVKILDFGLAKLVETSGPGLEHSVGGEAPTAVMQQYSVPGMIMGTLGYMSPEQAQAKKVDQRSDIFSFGCLLYEAATGRKPFAGDSFIDTLHKVIHDPAPAITNFNPSASPELQRVIRKCLAKEPEKRYQTIRDTVNDLEEVLEEMKGVSDIERSVAPSTNASSSSTPGITNADLPALSTASVTHPPASSAEYIFSGVKEHKFAAAVVVLLLIVGVAVGLGLYLSAGKTAVAIESIAVLPFQNSSGDPNVEYLSDGIAESLINSLTQLQQLKVIARSTAFRYKGKDADPQTVGRELNVRTVLMGRVGQMGDRLNIQVDLVDAATGAQLWGQEYERPITDALSIKQAIAREVTEKLGQRLSGEQQQQLVRRETSNPEAYQFYLRGRYYWNRRTADGIKKAVQEFQQAIDRDPNYALAYAGLADCYLVLEQYVGAPASETLPNAKAAATRALLIDDSLAEAHTSLAAYYNATWQWKEAEKEFQRAINLNPNYPTARHWYQNYLRTMGRLDEALAEIKRARELDPLSPILGVNLASIYIRKGDLDSAMEEGRRLVELDPNFPLAHEPLGKVYIIQRKYPEAIAAFQQDVANDRTAYMLSILGYAYAVAGRRDEARAVLKELEEKYKRRESLGQYVALVHVGFGDVEQVFAWLEKDFQARSGFLEFMIRDPLFDSIRSDPRYADLVRRMGLEP